MTNVTEEVRSVVSKIMRVDMVEIGDSSSPATLPSWDSLHHMKLILALEERFGLTFTEDQIVHITTVARIVSTIGGMLTPS